MVEGSGVFLLQGEDSLIAMDPGQFATEDHFQRLLSRFPELLVGDQIDPHNPRRWILVKREQAISTGVFGASTWSIDHVFLDQDGIPTLVEIKRQSDSRIRREVVGQMLDYAANCITYWSVETLRSSLERTCLEAGKSSDAALRELLRSEEPIEDFWQRVKTNLEAKNIRLLFVADVIPLELRRVVEFLNDQMKQTEVLAVELRQFSSGQLRTIVPTIYGLTQAAASKRSTATQRWDEPSVFEKLAQVVGPKELEIARCIFEWMRKDGKRQLIFGAGKDNGSVYPAFKPQGTPINPVYLSSDGKLYVQFGALQNKPVFGAIQARQALMQRFNAIKNVNFRDVDLTKYPSIPLRVIADDPDGLKKTIETLKWMEQQIEAAA